MRYRLWLWYYRRIVKRDSLAGALVGIEFNRLAPVSVGHQLVKELIEEERRRGFEVDPNPIQRLIDDGCLPRNSRLLPR